MLLSVRCSVCEDVPEEEILLGTLKSPGKTVFYLMWSEATFSSVNTVFQMSAGGNTVCR